MQRTMEHPQGAFDIDPHNVNKPVTIHLQKAAFKIDAGHVQQHMKLNTFLPDAAE